MEQRLIAGSAPDEDGTKWLVIYSQTTLGEFTQNSGGGTGVTMLYTLRSVFG